MKKIFISLLILTIIGVSTGLIIWKTTNITKVNSSTKQEENKSKDSSTSNSQDTLNPIKDQKEFPIENIIPKPSLISKPQNPTLPKINNKNNIEQKIVNQLSKVENTFSLEIPQWSDKFLQNYKKIINEQKNIFSSLINNSSFLDEKNNSQEIKWTLENIKEIDEKIQADLVFEFIFENESIIQKKKINIKNILTLNKIKENVNNPYFWNLLVKDSTKQVESLFQNYENKNLILNQNNLYAQFGQGKVKTYYSKINNPILLEYLNIPDNIIPLENNQFQIWIMFINNETLNNPLGFLEFEIRIREKLNGDDKNFLEPKNANKVDDTQEYFSAFSEKTFIINGFSSSVKQNWESLIEYLNFDPEKSNKVVKINYDKENGLKIEELIKLEINQRYKEFLKYLNNDKFNYWKQFHEETNINYDVYITNIKENADKNGLELEIKLKLPHISFSEWKKEEYQENAFIIFNDTFKISYKK